MSNTINEISDESVSSLVSGQSEGLFSRLPGAAHKRKLFSDRPVEESVDSVGLSVTSSQHSLAQGVSAGIQAIVGRSSRKSSSSVNEYLPTQHEHGMRVDSEEGTPDVFSSRSVNALKLRFHDSDSSRWERKP